MFTQLEMQSRFNAPAVVQGLRATIDCLCSAFAEKRIIVLRYRSVPVLHEQVLVEALIDQIRRRSSGEHSYQVYSVGDRNELPTVSSSIARALVEVRDRFRAFLTIPEQLWPLLSQAHSFCIWKGYTHILDKIDDNPASFLTLMSARDDLPVYTERRLPELTFAAAIAQSHNPLTQEELEGLLDCIRSGYAQGRAYSYISWDRWQALGPLLPLYLDSLQLVGPARGFAEADRRFYLTWCFWQFCSAGQGDRFVKYCEEFSDEDAQYAGLLQHLQEHRLPAGSWDNAISFLIFLAGSYLLAESTAPTQYMGITSSPIDEPASVRAAIQILKGLGIGTQSLLAEDWRALGRQLMPWLLLLAPLASNLDLRPLSNNTRGLLEKFKETLGDYQANDLVSLLHKVARHCFLIGGACLLSDREMPQDMIKAYIAFWQRVTGMLKESQTFQEVPVTELQRELRVIASVHREFSGPLRTLQRLTTAGITKRELELAFESEDVVNAFFDVFARQLLANDFFVDSNNAPETAEALAKAYIELDKATCSRLLDGTLNNAKASTLVQQLQFESEYDQIYVLVIDGFSYLDWKLSKDWVKEDLKTWLNPSEGYCYSALPTYTPCALSALLTGYAPHVSGLWDWQVMVAAGELMNLSEVSEAQCRASIHVHEQPVNTMTLVHSYGDTGLSAVLRMLVNMPMVDLPTTSQSKAINRATQIIYEHPFQTRLVVFYIADFDQFAHQYLYEDAWEQYYRMQAQRIVRNLIVPLLRREKETSSRVLIVLTADHGKLTRYESRMLAKLLPESDGFRRSAELLGPYLWRKSLRHLLGYIPQSDFERITRELKAGFADKSDIQMLFDMDLAEHNPCRHATSLVNPNFLLMSRYGVEGHAIGHGGASLSEIVIPFVRFEQGGR